MYTQSSTDAIAFACASYDKYASKVEKSGKKPVSFIKFAFGMF